MNVAVKIINKQRAPKDFLDNFLPRELDILACLNHRNIVKTYEIFETSSGKVYMVMELGVQGTLLEFIEFRGALPPEFCKKLFRQMARAIKFIHDQDIVHRDIKCENLLLDKDFNLKIADFGFSRRLTDSDGAMELSKTFCGSEGYAAPEVLQGIPYDPKLYDVWSMGIVLFVMAPSNEMATATRSPRPNQILRQTYLCSVQQSELSGWKCFIHATGVTEDYLADTAAVRKMITIQQMLGISRDVR
ncbi:hypothetical protein AALO_G00170680 [Alosa alosa]|uniref:non-specific serine/threonine protein kinase n=1 Tax=Alosa alosa TaxID=278164 RepID=A0AAV6GCR4_9TELE|nr:hypothetical protein AALO_G00170680 [Alosa alosa]